MQRIACFLLLFVWLTSCKEEDHVPMASQTATPELSARGINNDNFTFAVTLKKEAGEGTFYYVVLEETAVKPTTAEMKSHVLSQHMTLKGDQLRTVNMPGCASETNYVVYGMMEIDGVASQIVELKVTTL